jgi:hypothetical protein
MPTECLKGRPGTAEQQDVDVLFGSNQYHMDQLSYNNLLDDSSRGHPSILSGVNIDKLEEVDALDHRPSDFDLDNLGTINPAASNI